MADKPAAIPGKPEIPKPKTDWPAAFKDWAAGRTGLTNEELIYVFSRSFSLTEAETKSLGGVLKPALPLKELPKPTTPPVAKPPVQPTVKPSLIIGRTPYPKWWNDSLNATISLTAPGSQVLATAYGTLKLFASTIVLTVTGETVITFSFGSAGSSGPIYLGGEGQPMGMVVAMGNSPAPCGPGPLLISATDPGGVNAQIGGWATCFAVEGKKWEK